MSIPRIPRSKLRGCLLLRANYGIEYVPGYFPYAYF